MSYPIVKALREQGKERRELGRSVQYEGIARLRKRLRRRYAVRLWAGRILVTIGYIVLTGLSVALMVSL